MRRIFDFHTHAYPEKVASKSVDFLNQYYKITCRGDGTMEDLLRSARDGGVGYLLVHAVATKPRQVENVNSWIAAQLQSNVFGFGTIHPGYERIEQELARIRSLGLLGLKLHPDFQGYYVDDPSMDIVYANIAGKMPVLVHSGDETSEFSSPKRLANVLDRHPKLTVIAAHLGGYSQWAEAERYIIGRDCYIDTSSSLWAIPPEKAAALIRMHGADKVLFGTDYPLVRHQEELARFMALDLTDGEKDKILFENAKRLLKLDI
jgi:Predicted metal-dependent hydrolase of the TIM-barrel fold